MFDTFSVGKTKSQIPMVSAKRLHHRLKCLSPLATKKNGILRSQVIREILNCVNNNTRIISTTGYTSRELNQIRKRDNLKTGEDFYMVGGMGHSLMVSLGHSLNKKNSVICLDGDGSIFMHLGSFRTTGIFGKKSDKDLKALSPLVNQINEKYIIT